MRLFVAANLDSELRGQIFDAAKGLRDAAPTVAWIRRELLHMTIKFLGEQETGLVSGLTSALRRVGESAHPIDLRLHGFGAFPNFRAPHVVWMGGDAPASLTALAAAVDEACAALGVERDERPFRSHITLGRIRRPLGRGERRLLAEAADGRHEALRWHVQTFELMRSELGSGGPTYAVVESFPLGTPAKR